MRGNDQQIDDPALVAPGEGVLAQEDLLVLLKLLAQFQAVVVALLVAVGVGEGKLDAGYILGEQEVKLEDQFLLVVEGKAKDRVRQSFPISEVTVLIVDAADGAVEVVAFGLGR